MIKERISKPIKGKEIRLKILTILSLMKKRNPILKNLLMKRMR